MRAKFETKTPISNECCSHKPYQIHQTHNQSPIYGKPNKLRCQQPDMFQILTWNDPTYQSQIQKSHSQSNMHHYNQRSVPLQTHQVKDKYCQRQVEELGLQRKVALSKSKRKMMGGIQNKQQFSFRKDIHGQNPNREVNVGQEGQSLKKLNPKLNFSNFDNKNQNNKKQQKIKNNNLVKTKASSTKLIKTHTLTPKNISTQARYLSPKAQIHHNLDQETLQSLSKQALKKFKQTTRDLSNSAFLTYFNKPPFQAYGRGNTHNPRVLYGDYMYSHNIIPHTSDNKPKNQQTYQTALIKAKSSGNLHPRPPLTKFQLGNSLSYHTIGQIYPNSTNIKSFQIQKIDLQKLPKFSMPKQDQQNRRNFYVRENMVQRQQFLTNDQFEQTFWKSTKNDIDGRQIQYEKKIQKLRKDSYQY